MCLDRQIRLRQRAPPQRDPEPLINRRGVRDESGTLESGHFAPVQGSWFPSAFSR